MAARTTEPRIVEETKVTAPDQSWSELYRAGGISAFLFVLLTIVYSVMAAITPQPPSTGETGALPGGVATLEYIADHKSLYLLNMILFIGPVTLTTVVFLALFVALSRASKSVAAIGAMVGITSVVLCVTPAALLFGLVPLSDQYAAATSAAQHAAIATTAEGLVAQINAVSFGGVLFAVGVLVISLAMLGGVFPKIVAYLGIITGIVGIVCESLRPVIGAGYGVYGILLVWLVFVGWTLWRLDGRQPSGASR
ncbi:MAG: DUF4386 family protein [Ktedonobacterales bacterium]